MKVLHIDTNHPCLIEGLAALGFENHVQYTAPKEAILKIISQYEGLILRSRFPIDRAFLKAATNLKFIGRVGAGLENIDLATAAELGVFLAAAPEGNSNAVGEHSLGLLLALFQKLHTADQEVRQGIWDRSGNRGIELDGQTVGIIGYGHMGQAFAKKLSGFDVEIIYHDLKEIPPLAGCSQVSLETLQSRATVLSLHLPQTPETIGLVNTHFISNFKNPFWLLNTGRGSAVVTADLVKAIEKGQIKGAGLDVLEYETSSFESFLNDTNKPEALRYLMESKKVILSPHVAGWTHESHEKLAKTVVEKIAVHFGMSS